MSTPMGIDDLRPSGGCYTPLAAYNNYAIMNRIVILGASRCDKALIVHPARSSGHKLNDAGGS
jgi:hypothetical protein